MDAKWGSRFVGGALLVMLGMGFASGASARAETFEEWLGVQKDAALRDFFNNISPPDTARGVVVAAVSRQSPNYYYHWTRDAALTMEVVTGLYRTTGNAAVKQRYFQMLVDYLRFSRFNQLTPNRSAGPGTRGLGEPKFNVDG